MRRFFFHLILAGLSGSLVLTIYFSVTSSHAMFRWSMASGYAGLALISASLFVGPWNVIRGAPNPVNISWRRDVGIWGGVLGFVHTVLGLQVHMSGQFWRYFLFPSEEAHFIPLRYDLFGIANYTGLGITLILLLLLGLSNNYSLIRLGRRRWKALQRWNYIAFVLLVLHGAAYQFLETRAWPFIVLFAAIVVCVGAFQLSAFKKMTHDENVITRARLIPKRGCEDIR
jgi:sulfoxide reductase heme-binding subunit YedZ